MQLELSHTFVSVEDQDAALDFYTRVLGLVVVTDFTFPENGMRWLSLSPPEQPRLEIVLERPHPGLPQADQNSLGDLRAKGALQGLVFLTRDCDAIFAELQAAGATITQEPTDQMYGVRDCAIRDPAGNMIRFSERLPGGMAGV